MKIVKVSEIVDGLRDLIQKKKEEQKQILALGDEVNNLMSLVEIAEPSYKHFITLHENAIHFFNVFIEEYIEILQDIKHSVESFEVNTRFIDTNFLEADVKEKLNELDEITNGIINDINTNFDEISDLIDNGRISTYYFNLKLNNARLHSENTVKQLEMLDKKSTSSLKPAEDTVHAISLFTTNLHSWAKKDPFPNDIQLDEIKDFNNRLDTIQTKKRTNNT